VYVDGQPLAAIALSADERGIHDIYAVGNPDKLKNLPRPE
jgi:hypothetical protein